MTYAIEFNFPDAPQVLYAGIHKGALGWAPTLGTAKMFEDEDEALRYLEKGYGASRRFGRVISVTPGYPTGAGISNQGHHDV